MDLQQASNHAVDCQPISWEQRFIDGVIQRCQKDNGLAARLRRADNPATEYQCWDLLAAYGVDLEQESLRLACATVVAALAKANIDHRGSLCLGRAIAECYEDGRESQQAKARLRRLLACADVPETCRILRPLFSLIESKVSRPLDFARILRQLKRFKFDTEKIKAEWAQEFYSQASKEDRQEDPST